MKTSSITLKLLMGALLHVLERVLGDFVMTVRRVGGIATIELTEGDATQPTLVTKLDTGATAPTTAPVQLAIPGTETSTPAAAPSAPAPAPAAEEPTRPPFTDACVDEHMGVGYRYGFAVKELDGLSPEAIAALTLKTGLRVEPSDGPVRWTTPTADAVRLAGIHVWAMRHKLHVHIDPDDPRCRVLEVDDDVWQRHHEGLLATKYRWGIEGWGGEHRVAIVPPGGDLERIFAYAKEHGFEVRETIADAEQQPEAPGPKDLPAAPASKSPKAAKPTTPKAPTSKAATSKAKTPAAEKPQRRRAVPEADELAQGASDHRAVGLVHGTWQTVATRTAKQTAVEWSRLVNDRVTQGVRVRVYDRAGKCSYDSLDGGRP